MKRRKAEKVEKEKRLKRGRERRKGVKDEKEKRLKRGREKRRKGEKKNRRKEE